MAYSRDDVQTHYGSDRPAVNIKVPYRSLEDAWKDHERDERTDDGFTVEWIEENISGEKLDRLFWDACSFELEYLEGWATSTEPGDSLFPDDRVTFEQDGRSGGWLVVHGLPDIEDWDAVRIARWRRFERIARDIAAGIPAQVISLVYINDWQWQQDEQAERDRAARQDIATVERTSA